MVKVGGGAKVEGGGGPEGRGEGDREVLMVKVVGGSSWLRGGVRGKG